MDGVGTVEWVGALTRNWRLDPAVLTRAVAVPLPAERWPVPETHRARLIQKLMLTPLGPLLTALMNERQLSRTMGNVFGPDTQPSADLIHHFRELIS